ncbi:MAG: ABC transporter permease [bacterium]|jgi:ABC-2 type transport system permease protein|nr:ABC transporter permease [candidate division KSB1 bacterium]MDH7560182.1 ABC transporter permease [bacterium]
MRRVLCVIRKEFLQVFRDRAMVFLIFMAPIVQLVVLGYVVSSEVRHLATVVCDGDRSLHSRELVARLQSSKYFDVLLVEKDIKRLGDYFERGRAAVALVIPTGFSRDVVAGRTPALQVVLDGQDANSSNVALGYASGLMQDYLSEQLQHQACVLGRRPRVVEPRVQVWFNPDLRDRNYMIPGIVAFLLTLTTALLSGMGLVREKEVGTLEQLNVTPIKPYQLLLGKTIPFAILGFGEVALAIAVARLWYRIPLLGNIGLLALFVVLFLFTTLGIGLFVSSSSTTQQQAMFLTWFILIFALITSGFLFPIENMPVWIQALSYLNPLRYFMLVVRAIFIKGSGVSELWEQGVILAVFGLAILLVSARRFEKRIR